MPSSIDSREGFVLLLLFSSPSVLSFPRILCSSGWPWRFKLPCYHTQLHKWVFHLESHIFRVKGDFPSQWHSCQSHVSWSCWWICMWKLHTTISGIHCFPCSTCLWRQNTASLSIIFMSQFIFQNPSNFHTSMEVSKKSHSGFQPRF